MLVDSHCHLNYLDAPAVQLLAAREVGVTGFLCIGVDQSGIEAVLALAAAHADVWASVGQHPEAAAAEPQWIEQAVAREGVVALGEMGLDYHQETEAAGRNRQRECFAYQLSLAGKSQLPVVIHTRAAEADTLSHLRSQAGVIGVLHCFTESWDMASAALDLGYYISISGIVTFRNGDNVREVARKVPADRLLVETDAPWLAPVPHRGRKNVPAYVRDTAEYLAALRGTTLEELAQTTTANFFALFKKAQNSSSNSR